MRVSQLGFAAYVGVHCTSVDITCLNDGHTVNSVTQKDESLIQRRRRGPLVGFADLRESSGVAGQSPRSFPGHWFISPRSTVQRTLSDSEGRSWRMGHGRVDVSLLLDDGKFLISGM